MAGAVAYTEIKTKLADVFAGVYSVVEFDDVVTAEPTDDQPFIAIEDVPGAIEENTVIGGGPRPIGIIPPPYLRETGDILVHIFVRSDTGGGAGRTIADEVRRQMRLQPLGGGVAIKMITGPYPARFFAGLWTSYVVGLRYWRHFSEPTVVA